MIDIKLPPLEGLGFSEEQRAMMMDAGLKCRAESCRLDFLETQNPMFVFDAYLIHRKLSEQLPEWILEYLDTSMAEFWERYIEFHKEPHITTRTTSPQHAFASAFGIITSTNKTVWYDYYLEQEAEAIAVSIFKALYVDGVAKETRAAADVAARFRTSVSTAWRAWARFKRVNTTWMRALDVKRRGQAVDGFFWAAVYGMAAAGELKWGVIGAPDMKTAMSTGWLKFRGQCSDHEIGSSG